MEFTAIDWVPFKDVKWEFVVSEGEGFESVQEWQKAHKDFWSGLDIEVLDDTEVICYLFQVVSRL